MCEQLPFHAFLTMKKCRSVLTHLHVFGQNFALSIAFICGKVRILQNIWKNIIESQYIRIFSKNYWQIIEINPGPLKIIGCFKSIDVFLLSKVSGELSRNYQ